MTMKKMHFMEKAVKLSIRHMRNGKGGPFGAVVVKNGEIIAEGYNQVSTANDPTAHAEIVAIREACRKLNSFQLTGCEIYTTCEPCPMCLGAIYWARPDKIYYSNTKSQAAAIGFDDGLIYSEINLPPESRKIPMERLIHQKAINAFNEWEEKKDRIDY